MKRPELLAPVGNFACLEAAIEAGCDAVYLGGYAFGARSYASNFSREELKEAVEYAHLYGVKVYITVNTLVYEKQVLTFMDYVQYLVQIHVDALILQDLGMFDLVHQTYPTLELHASTQMHIHNLEGVKWAHEMGFHRAVVARETTIEEVEQMKREVPIELEVFVHGALCISYSGQCLMSSLIGGRSGNFGTCAGSCRQKYDICSQLDHGLEKLNQDDYVLSTKDLCTIEEIPRLMDIGVDSLKIEGRMKRPEYVYLVVSMYRKVIDMYLHEGKIHLSEDDIKELKNIYNREFTKGFLFHDKELMNPKRPNHMGTEIGKVIGIQGSKVKIQLSDRLVLGDGIRILANEDVGMTVTKIEKGNHFIKEGHPGDIVLLKVPNLVKIGCKVVKTTDKEQLDRVHTLQKEKNRKVKICGKIRLKIGDYPMLSLSDNECKVDVYGKTVVESAMNQPITRERVQIQLEKMGNSVYQLEELEIQMDDSIFIPVSLLNDLRRIGLEALTEKRLFRKSVEKKEYHRSLKSFPVEKKKNVLISSYAQYLQVQNADFDVIYVEKREVYDKIKGDHRVMLKLPRVMHRVMQSDRPVLISEVGCLRGDDPFSTDFSFNVVNSYTVAFLHALGAMGVTLSYELDDSQIQDICEGYWNRYQARPNLELIVEGREEVMITKFPFLSYYQSTSVHNYLRDRFGNLYPIVENEDFTIIYNYQIRKLEQVNRYYDMGVNQIRYQYSVEED